MIDGSLDLMSQENTLLQKISKEDVEKSVNNTKKRTSFLKKIRRKSDKKNINKTENISTQNSCYGNASNNISNDKIEKPDLIITYPPIEKLSVTKVRKLTSNKRNNEVLKDSFSSKSPTIRNDDKGYYSPRKLQSMNIKKEISISSSAKSSKGDVYNTHHIISQPTVKINKIDEKIDANISQNACEMEKLCDYNIVNEQTPTDINIIKIKQNNEISINHNIEDITNTNIKDDFEEQSVVLEGSEKFHNKIITPQKSHIERVSSQKNLIETNLKTESSHSHSIISNALILRNQNKYNEIFDNNKQKYLRTEISNTSNSLMNENKSKNISKAIEDSYEFNGNNKGILDNGIKDQSSINSNKNILGNNTNVQSKELFFPRNESKIITYKNILLDEKENNSKTIVELFSPNSTPEYNPMQYINVNSSSILSEKCENKDLLNTNLFPNNIYNNNTYANDNILRSNSNDIPYSKTDSRITFCENRPSNDKKIITNTTMELFSPKILQESKTSPDINVHSSSVLNKSTPKTNDDTFIQSLLESNVMNEDVMKILSYFKNLNTVESYSKKSLKVCENSSGEVKSIKQKIKSESNLNVLSPNDDEMTNVISLHSKQENYIKSLNLNEIESLKDHNFKRNEYENYLKEEFFDNNYKNNQNKKTYENNNQNLKSSISKECVNTMKSQEDFELAEDIHEEKAGVIKNNDSLDSSSKNNNYTSSKIDLSTKDEFTKSVSNEKVLISVSSLHSKQENYIESRLSSENNNVQRNGVGNYLDKNFFDDQNGKMCENNIQNIMSSKSKELQNTRMLRPTDLVLKENIDRNSASLIINLSTKADFTNNTYNEDKSVISLHSKQENYTKSLDYEKTVSIKGKNLQANGSGNYLKDQFFYTNSKNIENKKIYKNNNHNLISSRSKEDVNTIKPQQDFEFIKNLAKGNASIIRKNGSIDSSSKLNNISGSKIDLLTNIFEQTTVNEPIKLDFAFRSYVNNKNEQIIKSLNTDSLNSEVNVIFKEKNIKSPIQISLNSEHDLLILVKNKKKTEIPIESILIQEYNTKENYEIKNPSYSENSLNPNGPKREKSSLVNNTTNVINKINYENNEVEVNKLSEGKFK